MKYILTAVVSFCVLFTSAQKTINHLNYKAAIKISPIALLDVDNGIMLGGEYRFTPQLGLSLDVAYLFSSYYFSDIKKTRGFNIRPAFRYYLSKDRNYAFVQLQGFYKQVDYDMHGWLDKNLVNNIPSYSQIQEYRYNKEVWGINLMGGLLGAFSSGRFFLDIAVGLGVRFKKEGVTEPNSRIRPTGWRTSAEGEGKKTTISLPFSAKLAYKLY